MIPDHVAVIGAGRVGLCLALNLEQAGHEVLGIDSDARRVRHIRDKTVRSTEPGVEEALHRAGNLIVEEDLGAVRAFDPAVVFIAVDTPTRGDGGYDASNVDSVIHGLSTRAPRAERTELAVVSTVLPGYCDSRAAAAADAGYVLSYSPEFVAQGRIMRDQQCPAQVLVGEADQQAGDRILRLYRGTWRNVPSVHRMSRISAEIAKLATNAFLTMKIAFANAIGDLAVQVDADVERILDALGADPRVGPALLKYGFGYGGPCLPRDNRALDMFARQHGCELLQGKAADEMNRRHLEFQVEHYLRRYPEGEPIHFHSVTYKPGTELLDESQPLAVAVRLARTGRRVVIHEREDVVEELRARFSGLFEYCVERVVSA
jgi:UDPglucose 6-dehydrogenase